MREILFRGKTLTDKWVEGAYYKQDEFYGEKEDAHIIITSKETLDNDFALESHIVIPETIGQYTGLTDKNGTKIFEGDIVKFSYNENDKEPKFYSVEWKKDRACFGYAETADKMIEIDCFHCEVIGNIHDNPELLGGDLT